MMDYAKEYDRMVEQSNRQLERIEQLERENAALEKRLQEIQHMCLGYQEEHAELRKQLAEAEEELDRRPV